MTSEYNSRLIKMAELSTSKNRKGVLPLSPATIWRLSASEESDFPKPFKIGKRNTVWKISEIQAWVKAQQEGTKL